jgi:hypothetical protein
VTQYVEKYVEYVDTAVERASVTLRQSLSSAPWIPESMRPQPPPPPPPRVVFPHQHATALYERTQDWLWRHKVLVGVVVLATGAVAYRGYRRSRFCRKTRRARRARTGGRVEVLVVAGSPALPLTKSLSLDMERKGFIVFVVCNSDEDETLVQHMARPDIRALRIDITDVSGTQTQREAWEGTGSILREKERRNQN